MSHADKVRAEIAKFHILRDKYKEFGTWDSEIHWKFTNLVSKACNGERPNTPRGVEGWELYAMPGAGKAAQALTKQADRVASAILASPVSEIKKIFGGD